MRTLSVALALSFAVPVWSQQAPSVLDSARLGERLDFDGGQGKPAPALFAAPQTSPRIDLRLPKMTPEKKGQWLGALAGVGVSALMEANRKTVDPQNNALTPGGVFVMTGIVMIPFCALAGGELASWLHALRTKRRSHSPIDDGDPR